MKINKSLVFLLLAVICFSQVGCSLKANDKNSSLNEIVIINPTGPTIIPIIALADGKLTNEPAIKVEYWKTNDEVVAKLANSDADFAVLPITSAASLYAQQKDITLLGVHGWSLFYMLSANPEQYSDMHSLKGKSVFIPPARGNTIDLILRHAITKAGLTPDTDVKILYTAPQEIVQLFKSGKIEYAALPEPFVSAALDKPEQIVIDFQQYWHNITGQPARLPINGLFVRKEFKDQYPEITLQVADCFSKSVSWSNENQEEAIELSKEELNLPAPIIKLALTRIEFDYHPINTCKSEVEFFLHELQATFSNEINLLPDEEFYNK